MTGLGYHAYVEKNDAVAEMVERAGNALPNNICTSKEIARAALESLGIPLTVLAALRSGEWVAVPVRPKISMLAHAVLIGDEPSKDDERLAAMAIDGYPNVASRGLRSDVIQATAQIAADYRAMIAAAPKEP